MYAPGEKFYGPVPEVRYLPIDVIIRREMDFIPETLKVSKEVARRMDFSEPVDVTAFRDKQSGWLSTDPPRMQHVDEDDRVTPQVVLQDGHHRLAAAAQTGRSWLPVKLKSVNARGEKLNALIELSEQIEREEMNPSRKLKNRLMR